MIRSLEEMTTQTTPGGYDHETVTPNVSSQPNIEIHEPQTNSVEDEEEFKIPEHMYTDAEMVGYGDSQIQADVYNLAVSGVLPLTGNVRILDIGCGRGDLLTHVKYRLPTLDTEYIGYEMNPLLSTIGNQKLSKFTEKRNEIIPEDFLQSAIDGKFNYVFLIGSLNLNYGWDLPKWEYLDLMLRKSLDVTEIGGVVTFILLHDNDGVDNYISYPIPNITEVVLKYNFPFTLEYGLISGVYKLSIRKEPIFITTE